MTRAFGMTVLVVVIASGIPATAHHSNALYFDMSKEITLEGEVLRVEWINPHVLLFLQSKNVMPPDDASHDKPEGAQSGDG